MGVNNVNN